MSTPRYKQADQRWSQAALGFGPSTIGRAGCLLVCLCEAARALRDVEMPPPLLNSAGVDRKAFIHSMAITQKLGELAGLRVSEKITGDPSLLRGAIGEAFRGGGLVIAHVDHTGDAFGDHFVLLLEERYDASGNKRIAYADPATGREAELDAINLSGVTVWGTRAKTYRVLNVRTVHVAT